MRGGTSKGNILRHPRDVKYAVLYHSGARVEVWPRDTDLGVICMEMTMMPVLWLRLPPESR